MLDVRIEKKNEAYVLTIKGHAEAGEYGKDIVCASASILAYTLAQTAQYMHEQGKLIKKPKSILREGYSKVVMIPKEEYEAEVLYAYFFAQVGYSLLAHNYRQYVQVKMLEV